MKPKKLFLRAINAIVLSYTPFLNAQNFQTMPIASGFTDDVIANGVGSSAVTTTSDVDGFSFAFISRDFQLTSSSTPLTYGLPTDGIVNTVVTSTPGLSYMMGNYSGNNSLKLSSQNDNGTLVFATPKAAIRLYMLATSGSGASTVSVLVNFTDNTSQTFTGVTIADWYGATGFAIQGIGRIDRTNDGLDPGSGTNPRLYQTLLTIDPANQSKPIKSVKVTKTSSAQGYSNIFAFAADAFSTCAPPTLNALGTLTANTAAVSWTPANGTTATSYDIYYNTTNTAPASGATPNIIGISGNSATIPGLNPNTTYYYWVRANCTGATNQSVWSFSGTFKTVCGEMTTMFENFDSYGTGSIVPDCWIRLAGTGSQTITATTPASGTRNIYQFTSASATPTYTVLPVFSNINSGTNQIRLKARVSSGAPGTLTIGYVTNTADASTFVPIQALSITNTSYTAAGSEYIVPVPNTVPAGARLAIRGGNDSKSYYWDDIYWENSDVLSASNNNNKKKLSIYPNPFNDIISISQIEDVVSVSITDFSGKLIKTIDNPSKEINLRNLNAGNYLVTLRLKDKTQYTIKVVKK